MSSAGLRFEGAAWLLLEPKTTFYSPRYNQESLSVRCQLLPFWTQPQLVLQLGQVDYLVLHSSPGDACKRSGDPKETKKLLQLTVRPLDDVRRAQLYQTAARAQTLEVFVDVEHTRERLLRCLRGEQPRQEKRNVPQEKKLLDDAFITLEKAQQSRDRETAIDLYKEAERRFYEAEKVMADERSRELLRARRGDMQRTIRGLEEQVLRGREGTRRATEVAMDTPSPVAPVVAEVTTAPPVMDISARLEELRRFAVQQVNAAAQQENGTDLATRLAALKNEKAGPAPPVGDLAERLRRLRGDDGPAEVGGDNDFERKSAVDRVIDQVKDEIALGIEDGEIGVEDLKESDGDSDGDSDDDSKSSSSSHDSECSKCNKTSSRQTKKN